MTVKDFRVSMTPLKSIPNFGVIGPNGLTFTRSIHNPNSNLVRVIRFISDFEKEYGISPRKIDILNGVWDFSNKMYPWGKPAARGWNSNFFRVAVGVGFLRWFRDGDTIRWTIGSIPQIQSN